MIPLKLTLKGIYSYQTEQTVNFSKLIDAKIFGIFGSTGSGKSTLLEAISFALYSDLERLTTRDKRNYNMMNLKSDELLIDFEFMSGTADDQNYRIIVNGKRNKKRFDDVKSFDRRTYIKSNGEWIPEDINTPAVTGLSYLNFKRTIIIPQGKFQEFLQLGEADRITMLKEIFRLEKFDLYKKTSLLLLNTRNELNIAEAALEKVNEVSSDLIEHKKKGMKTLIKAIKLKESRAEKLRVKLSNFVKLKDDFESLNKARESLDAVLRTEKEYKMRETQLTLFNKYTSNFKDLLEQGKLKEESVKMLERELDSKQTQLIELEKHLKDLIKSHAIIKEQFDKRDLYNKKITELESIISIKKLAVDINDQKKELLTAQKQLNTNKSTFKQTRDDIEEITKELKSARSSKPDIAVLHQIKAWIEKKKNLIEGLSGMKNDSLTITGEIEQLKDNIDNKLKETKYYDMIVRIKQKERMKFLSDKRTQLKSDIKEARTIERKLLKDNQLCELAGGLMEGDPCPVCGSKIHPNKLNPGNIAQEFSNIQTKCNDLEREIEGLNELITELKELCRELDIQTKQFNRQEFSIEEQEAEIEIHEKKFKWPEFKNTPSEKVDSLISKVETINAKINRLEAEKDKNERTLNDINEGIDQLNNTANEIKQTLAGLKSKQETLQKQLKLLRLEDHSRKPLPAIEDECVSLGKQAETLEIEYKRIDQELMRTRKDFDTLKGAMDGDTKYLGKEKEHLHALNTKIIDRLHEMGDPSLKEVRRILSLELDPEDETDKISKFKEELQGARLKFQELELRTKGKSFDSDVYKKIKNDLETSKEKISSLNQSLGELSNGVKDLECKLKEKSHLEKTCTKLRSKLDNIKKISDIFRANGFVNYVSTIYLQELCNAANTRFMKLTKYALKIELAPDNSLQVRDYLNEGKTRSIKTLSGGQMFQASLSLAIALADSIHKINRSNRNFFFIDEGFGSLDKESLQEVFETLKSLRKENRIVGIISHVEEIQQEIDAYICVTRDEKGTILQSSI